LPAKSGYALVIRDLLRWHREFPGDWRKAWQALQDKWDKNDPCPDGAFSEFNIDARLNGAYIAMGLLYGGGDFDRTMEISTRCGQDSDCNPSNAAGVMGTILGHRKIPARHRAEIDKLANRKFAYTEYSFNDIVLSTETRALQTIRETGGKVTDGDVTIRKQTPKPVRVKPSNIGIPREALAPEAPAWTWGPGWTTENGARVAQAAGREATLKFEGSGVALIGVLHQDGGRADVYLDGKLQAPVADAWIPERTHDNDLWHMLGLKSGPHTLRIVTREDADARSKGKRVAIERALIYRAP
jgi:hypothetical protein